MPPGRAQEPIELRLQQRQVAILAAAALVLLGVVFALGVLVGRQIASAALAAPRQPAAGELAALDAARDPVTPRAPAPRPPAPGDPKAADKPAPARADAPKGDGAKTDAAKADVARPDPAKSGPAAPAKAEPSKGEVAKADPAKAAPARPAAAPVAAKPADDAPPTPDEALEDDEPAPGSKAAPAPAPRSAAAPAGKGTPAAAPKPSSPASLAPPPKDPGNFTVQLGASPDRAVALKIEARARAAGLKPYVVEADLGAKGTWYRVRAGAFATKDEAASFQKDVERELRVSAMVMPAR